MHTLARASLCGLALLLSAVAQTPSASPAGHYEGTLSTPNGDMHMTVDIDKNAKGEWAGSSALSPGPTGILLEKLTVDGENVSWAMGIPGAPSYKATWNKETKVLKGTLEARGASIPLELKRSGEAKLDVPPPSTAIAKELEGKWAGSVETPNGQTLRLELEVTNASGAGSAVLTSLDQNNAKIPVNSITQKGSDFAMELRMVGAKFAGKVSADNTAIAGAMEQGGGSMPLKFTRPAAAPTVK
ncbi:MAG: hypothetical protein SGI92_18410 [Bryobacteraceae bacterium]|nr:hypothetical protein [Bryobacteraceae bacterium]